MDDVELMSVTSESTSAPRCPLKCQKPLSEIMTDTGYSVRQLASGIEKGL